MAESNHYPILELDSTYISSGSAANISNLSNLMYAELEHLIKKFGEESFLPLVKLVKNTFESLYESDKQKEAILRELEVLEHDHTMLLSKQQAEKNELKILEEHTCELEDSLQEKMKKIESLQSSLCSTKKIYEMKLQNMRDYISRLEEQDREHQNNYANLHSRYKELLNVNLDLTERIRICNEEGDVKIPSSSWNKGQVLSTDFEPTSSTMVVTNPLMLVSHKGDSPYEWGVHRRLHGNAFSEITLDADGSPFSKLSADDNCDEVSNSEEKSESGDFGGCASPIQRENNANEFNAIKEVNKLVNDCNEKDCRINALNVVINDLATNLDELAIEKEQLKETLSQMQICRSSMQLHIKQLDEENTRLKKELADLKALQRQMALNETPFSRRRNFTREEMAKVLMDRIQLQEDFDDLREKYSSALNSERRRNASDKMHAENSPFLNFFSRLFKRQRPLAPRVSFDPSNSDISIDFSGTRAFDPDLVNSSRDRRLNRSDAVNVASCNQWWIPVPIIGRPCEPEPVVMQSTISLRRRQSTPQSPLRGGGNCLPPPLPQHLYLRPISEALSNEMRLICCTCLYSNVGGLLPSGEQIAGRSTFFTPQPSDPSSSSASTGSVSEPLSSQLWMCLVGVVGTAVVTATKVDPAAGVPSSSSSPSSGVKVECRPSFRSQVVVVDVNKPSRYVDSFCLQRSVVACMATIPGAKERDYDVLRLSRNTWESIPFAVPNSTEENSIENNPDTSQPSTSRPATAEIDLDEEEEDEEHPASIQTNNTLSSLRHFAETAGKDAVGERLFKVLKEQQIREKSATLSSNSTTANVSLRTSAFDPDLVLEGNPADFYRVERQKFKKITPSSNQSRTFVDDSDMMPSASAQQTVWIGCQNGDIFIHSCDSAQRRPLQSTRLPAGVTAIRHFSGRVFVSLADGHIVVFRRQIRRPEAISGDGHTSPPLPPLRASSPIPPDSDVRISSTSQNQLSIDEELTEAVTAAGVWDLSEAVVIRCAPSGQSPIKSLTVVPPALTIWAGIRNRVLVIDATTFQRLYAFDVVSKSSATVRQLCFCRDGVWISLRDEHSLHLFNAFTYELMQVVDMAYVINETVGAPDSHLLTVSSSVTALEASADHLWIGTKGGHVACMPFKRHSPSKQVSLNTSKTSSASYSTENGNQEDASPPTSQVDLSGASVSGYGHKEAVNFFGIVGGDPSACSTASATSSTSARLPSTSNSGLFMISGGVGLVEHDRVSNSSLARVKENVEKPASKLQNHLLVWSLPSMGDPSKPH
ncbi:hypothetical protein Aperf_G00000113930 [Anoplocephala perfoliata]